MLEDFYSSRNLLDSFNNALKFTEKQYSPEQSARQRAGQPYFNAEFEIKSVGKRIKYIREQIKSVRNLPTSIYKEYSPNITEKEISKRKRQDIDDLERELRGLQGDVKYIRKIISDSESRQ